MEEAIAHCTRREREIRSEKGIKAWDLTSRHGDSDKVRAVGNIPVFLVGVEYDANHIEEEDQQDSGEDLQRSDDKIGRPRREMLAQIFANVFHNHLTILNVDNMIMQVKVVIATTNQRNQVSIRRRRWNGSKQQQDGWNLSVHTAKLSSCQVVKLSRIDVRWKYSDDEVMIDAR